MTVPKLSHDSEVLVTNRLQRAFVPSIYELAGLPLFSLLILVVTNSLTYFKSVNSTSYFFVTDYMQLRFKETLHFLDGFLGSTIPTVMFWMFIGLIVYILIWFGSSAYFAYRNDVPLTAGMVLPDGTNRSKLLRESVAHFGVRIVAFGLLLCWIYFLFAEILPFASDTFLANVNDVSLISVLNVIWSVLLLSASIFTLFILSRCVVMRNRVFSN